MGNMEYKINGDYLFVYNLENFTPDRFRTYSYKYGSDKSIQFYIKRPDTLFYLLSKLGEINIKSALDDEGDII